MCCDPCSGEEIASPSVEEWRVLFAFGVSPCQPSSCLRTIHSRPAAQATHSACVRCCQVVLQTINILIRLIRIMPFPSKPHPRNAATGFSRTTETCLPRRTRRRTGSMPPRASSTFPWETPTARRRSATS